MIDAVGAAPALVAGPDSAWFREFEKPVLYPPPAVFGVVWTAPFTPMCVALWLVWRRDADGRRAALALFGFQIALDVAWTPAFFALEALVVASRSSSRCGLLSSRPSRPSTGSTAGPRRFRSRVRRG